MPPTAGRRIAVSALVTLAGVAIVPALVVGSLRRAAVDSDQFADRATAALRDDSVRSLIAERVTDDLALRRASDLLAARPLIETVAAAVVGGRAFTGAFRSAARDVHRAVFNRDQHTVTLTVADVGMMAAAVLQVARPSLADQLDTTRQVEVARRDVGGVSVTAARVAEAIRLLAPLLALVAVLSAAGAVWLSADRRRTTVHLGVAAAVGGLVVVRGMYLCHSFCELGDTRLHDALDDLHDFLVANPGEVVVVINPDDVTPKDFVGAVRAAGLDRLAYRGPVAGRWPTLREMIDSGRRVVFLAENHAGAAPWHHLAYEAITEETPYAFSKRAQLTAASGLATTCRPNRGPAKAPLFLVNHWITTDPVPLRSDATKVNAYGPLMRGPDECERIRHHIPNLVAVNFYRRGALLRAVDALNGVDG